MSEGRKTQNLVIDYLVQKRKKMITGGDGRCDSPGYLAKCGTHLITRMMALKVFNAQVKPLSLHSNEVRIFLFSSLTFLSRF